jgi:hypothetical protein
MISNGSSPEYKQAFAWVVWVVAHEMMHIVRERVRTSICGNGERVKAYESVSEKTTPPRLRSSNRPQDKLWQPPSEPPSGHTLVTSSSHSLPTSAAKPTIQESHPASVPTTPLKANDIPFEPKGESGHWLEDKLTGGCSLEPIVSDFFTRHEAIHVPDGLPLTVRLHLG